MRRTRRRLVPPLAGAPAIDRLRHQRADAFHILWSGAEVERGLDLAAIAREQRSAELQISGERFQHVLPGTRRLRVTHAHRLAATERAHDVGHDAIRGPVAAADHVAGTRAGDHDAIGVLEETAAVAADHDLRGGLAAAVDVAAAERVVLRIPAFPLAVFVALVAGDQHERHGTSRLARRFHHVDGAKDVGRDRFGGQPVAGSNNGLRGEVKHGVGPKVVPHAAEMIEVANVAVHLAHQAIDAGLLEERGAGRRIEAVAEDLRAERVEPDRQPAALEPGVAGHEHAAAAVLISPRVVVRDHGRAYRTCACCQTAHGARCFAHISVSCW